MHLVFAHIWQATPHKAAGRVGDIHLSHQSLVTNWLSNRVVKRSSDLRTSNFKFEFIFVLQPFDIRIQASLIRRRRFCFESGAQRCTVWRFLCSLPAVNSSDARCVFAYPSLHTASVQLLSVLRPWHVLYTNVMQAITVTNLGGPDTELTSMDGNRAWRGLTSWLIALLIDCFPACGVCAVTFISPHSADIKHKSLKLLHKYINKVRI